MIVKISIVKLKFMTMLVAIYIGDFQAMYANFIRFVLSILLIPKSDSYITLMTIQY